LDHERENSKDLKKEDVRTITHFLDCNELITLSREKAYAIIQNDPLLNYPRAMDLTTAEAKHLCFKQIKRAREIVMPMSHIDRESFILTMSRFDASFQMRIGVHFGLFDITLQAQGSPEQMERYKNDIRSLKMIGCFAMTELGHSSHLRGIETTATYDRERQEFIINSPTLTSTKWWIGMAGHTATHTLALCNLVLDGKKKGLHWFLVPLRDPETGQALPGIRVGELGEKIARPGLDSGWIQFKEIKLPRDAMMTKWSNIDGGGKYTPPVSANISYLPLISERLDIISLTAFDVSKAITIGIRYACVRVQSDPPVPIIDYQYQQYRLLPILATNYALLCV